MKVAIFITGHQAFFTRNALERIADTTLANITAFEQGHTSPNVVTVDRMMAPPKEPGS